MGRNLRNTLNGRLSSKLPVDREPEFDFGIEIGIGGIGITASTENGGTIGVGIAIIGVEVNAQGGGSVEYLNGLYRIEVTKSGCSYLKDYYIGGFYTHTEVEKIPGCGEDPKKKPKKPPGGNSGNDSQGSSAKRIESYESVAGETWHIKSTTRSTDVYVRKPIFNEKGYRAGFSVVSDGNVTETTQRFPESILSDYKITNHTAVEYRTRGILAYFFIPNSFLEEKASPEESDLDVVERFRRIRQSPYAPKTFGWGSIRDPEEALRLKAGPGGSFRYDRVGVTASYTWEVISNEGLTPEQYRRRPRLQPPVNRNRNRNRNGDGDEMEKCCFTDDDRVLLISIVLALKSLSFPGTITVENKDNQLNIGGQFPTGNNSGGENETFIADYVGLKLWQTKMLLEHGGSASIEKFLGINQPLIPSGEEEFTDDSRNIGFPIKIPDYLNQPKDKEGKFIKDLSEYPQRTINNFRELALYRFEMEQRLYRFSGAGPTLTDGFNIPLDIMIPLADKDAAESPSTIPGILSRIISIITNFGFPPLLKFNMKTPGGRVPVDALSSKDYIETMGDLIAESYTKVVRNQITVTKLALESSELHKHSVLNYRLLKLIKKGLGIPWRAVTTEKEAKKEGQDIFIDSHFNAAGFLSGQGFEEGNGGPGKGKGKGSRRNPTPNPKRSSEDIDLIQDEVNKPGKIFIKGFETKEKVLSMWQQLFNKQ